MPILSFIPSTTQTIKTQISPKIHAPNQENRDIRQTIPDHRVKLTSDGWTQAHDSGRCLHSLLRADDTVHFTSPYRRTRETTEGILSTLTSDELLIIRKKEYSGKYILENNFRTCFELKRERLAAAAAKDKANPSSTSTPVSADTQCTINGCRF
jgi:broad specificity phosphatase PhoE